MLLAFALAWTSSQAWASTWNLSFQEALNALLQSNSELKASQQQYEAAREREGQALSGFFPSVSADLELNYGTSNPESRRWTASLTGSYNLFSGGQDGARVAQSQYNTLAAQSSMRATRARVIAELKSTFAGWLYAKAFEDLAGSISKRRMDNLRLVQLRFASGRENRGSVLLSEAYMAQAKYDVLVASNLRRVADAQLAKVTGMESPSGERIEYDLQGDVPTTPPAESTPSFTELARQVPEVIQARATARAAERAIAVARSEFFPTLDARGAINSIGSGVTPLERDSWSLGLGLSFPLFDGYRDTYAVRAAAAAGRAADSDQSTAYRLAIQRLEQTYASYSEAVAKLGVDERFRSAAQLRAEIARKRYNNGLLSFEDWDQIENDLIIRQKAFLVSRRDRVSAEAAWEHALGGGL